MASTTHARMDITPARPAARPREIKVNLPYELCIQLHSRKILTGVTIAETVSAALRAYFAQAGQEAHGDIRHLDVDVGQRS